MMRNIIVNADDLGISIEVDAQIENCIKSGTISSSTLIANAPAFSDGVRIAKQYPQISIGVHLNIIEFAPLTNQDIFARHGLLNNQGCFIEGAITSIEIDNEVKQAVFEEWDAQISRIEEAGISPSHCDSHQHTHTLEPLKEVLCAVLKKHGINKVRRKNEISLRLIMRMRQYTQVKLDKSTAMQPKRRSLLFRRINLFVEKYKAWHWNLKMSKRFSMTDAFYAFRFFAHDRDVIKLGGPNSTIELMCHPGHPAYKEETSLLSQVSRLQGEGFALITYREKL